MNKIGEMLVVDGGTVKSEENGIVKGLAIVFGSPSEPDQSAERDFFTPETFIMRKTSFEVPLYHNHGYPLKEQIGEATLTKTSNGWEAVGHLDLANPLAQKVYDEAKTTQYGFSTGALTHLVERESKENNTNFLKRWVVGELSLTKRPAERKAVVQAIKSIDGEIVYEDAFQDESKNAVSTTTTQAEGNDIMVKNTEIVIYDKDGNKIWDTDSEISQLQEAQKSASRIELKDIDGSVQYTISSVSDDYSSGTSISVYQWGGAQSLIAKLKEIIDAADQAIQADITEDQSEPADPLSIGTGLDDESKSLSKDEIKSFIKQVLEEENIEPDNDELAELRAQLSNSEKALTEANERIAQLSILAGAKETIDKYKGN